MRQSKRLFFGASGLMAAALTLGLGSSPAWACHGTGSNANGSSSKTTSNRPSDSKTTTARSTSDDASGGQSSDKASTSRSGPSKVDRDQGNGESSGTGSAANAKGSNSEGSNAKGSSKSNNSGTGSDQPPGNNGTVKIDDYTVDSGQDNDAHVGCGFTVSFYGYDGTKAQSASIFVTPVAPTSGGSTYTKSTGWTVPSRTSGSQLDQQVQILGSDLTPYLAGVTPQAKQGYHLRLEVEVTGSQGSDDKYKVFWMQPCSTVGSGGGSVTTPPSTPVTPGQTSPGGSQSSSRLTDTSTAAKTASLAAGAATATASRASSAPADSAAGPLAALSTPGQSAAVPTSASHPSSGSLAFTGASVAGLVVLGFGLIAAGLLLTRRWRRAHA